MTAERSERAGPRGWIDGTAPQMQEHSLRLQPLGFIEYCLRGVGQVQFTNNPISGLLVLVAAWTYSPWLGFGGTLGVIVSTLAAHLLGFDRGAIRAGLFGFNGVLVGLALATFLAPAWDPIVMVWIIAVSSASTVLMAGFAAVFASWGVPPFTLAFNISTLLFLVTALNVARGRVGELVTPTAPAVTGPRVSTTLRETADATGNTDVAAILNAIFRGIGQLFFANSILGGVLVLAGIVICSRIAAVFALVGSTLGMLTGMALGADGVAIYNGLWGFNSYDACLAIAGVFYVLSWRSALLGAAAAIFTALLFGALSSIFGPWGLPALTLPFCFGTLAFVLIKDATTRFTWVAPADIETPEAHLDRHRKSHVPDGSAGTAAPQPDRPLRWSARSAPPASRSSGADRQAGPTATPAARGRAGCPRRAPRACAVRARA